MPVFGDRKVDTSGVELRGRGGRSAAVGGGMGIVGLIAYLLVSLLGGGKIGALQLPNDTEVSGTGENVTEMQTRCNAGGALERYDDCYLVKVYNEINDVWSEDIERYRPPRLAFFQDAVQTGCGNASADVGPFYCPADEEIFIELGFLQQLQEQFGAQGRYAQAYILAHEAGHHLQTLLGSHEARSNAQSVRMELQADCYAGVWGRKANDRGKVSITEAELDEAQRAAAAVGDDRIQQKTQGRVDPESWTHGSAEQRRMSYLKGFRSGERSACGDPA